MSQQGRLRVVEGSDDTGALLPTPVRSFTGMRSHVERRAAKPGARGRELYEELLRHTYGAFNARNADAALALMQPEVSWATANDGYVKGQGGLREYWRRQWKVSQPLLEPVSFREIAAFQTAVEVRATVRQGELASESMQEHTFTMRDGLIASMELRVL